VNPAEQEELDQIRALWASLEESKRFAAPTGSRDELEFYFGAVVRDLGLRVDGLRSSYAVIEVQDQLNEIEKEVEVCRRIGFLALDRKSNAQPNG
jgi:hypothetical protein